MADIVVKAGEVITDMGHFVAPLSKAQTGITLVRFTPASPKIEASQERMPGWNMKPIKGLMKVHALLPFRQLIHDNVVKSTGNLVNTVTNGYLGRHTTQHVEDIKQDGSEQD